MLDKVPYIKHLLRVVQLPLPLTLQIGIQPVGRPEVGYPTRSRYARSGENDDVFRVAEQVDSVRERVVLR